MIKILSLIMNFMFMKGIFCYKIILLLSFLYKLLLSLQFATKELAYSFHHMARNFCMIEYIYL